MYIKESLIVFILFGILSCGNNSQRPHLDGNQQRDLFDSILSLSFEANKLLQPPDGELSFKISEDNEKVAIKKIRKSIELSNDLNPDFLKFLDKDLPNAFYNFLIEGNKTYLLGLENDSFTQQVKGIELNIKWIEYWSENSNTILEKMYPTEQSQ